MSQGDRRGSRGRRKGPRARGAAARDPLEAALEAVPSPAFLVRGAGEIVRANVRGGALLEAEPDEVLRALTGPEDAATRRIPVVGAEGYSLVVLAERPGDPRPRAAAAALRWGLSPRHRDVLVLLVTGATNAAVARALACSAKTVETHVTAILARAGAASRSELIARFWSGGP